MHLGYGYLHIYDDYLSAQWFSDHIESNPNGLNQAEDLYGYCLFHNKHMTREQISHTTKLPSQIPTSNTTIEQILRKTT